MIKRHERPRQVPGAPERAALGGVIERAGPIHVSNVADRPQGQTPTRVGSSAGRQGFRVAKPLEARGSTDGCHHTPPRG